MERVLRHRFLLLLMSLLLAIVIYPMFRVDLETRLLDDLVLTFVFLMAIPALIREQALRWFALILGVPTVIGIWLGYIVPDVPRATSIVGFHLIAIAFFSITIGATLHTIYRAPEITVDSVFGAFSGYLLLGLVFSHVFSIAEALHPGAFHCAAGMLENNPDERHAILTYFSFTTLSTLGYGDIVPVKPVARSLSMVEAIAGQFYVAVLLAEVIGKRVSQVASERRPVPSGDSTRNPQNMV